VFPKATVGYCVTRYVGAKAIMAAVPEMMQRCTLLWRDERDAMPPQVGFTNFLTHVN
jgi:hypothetical protein